MTVECPECTNVDPIQVTFYNETLLNSTWILHGLNLLVHQANLSQTDFTIFRVSGQTRDGVIRIYNSTVGSLKLRGPEMFHINIVKSELDGTERPRKTLLDVSNTRLYINKSTFRNNKVEVGPALIKAANSLVMVENCTFLENVGQTGLFEITNGSNLNMTDSEFKHNGHWFFALSTIAIRRSSSASITGCSFVNNMAANGAALCSFHNTSLMVNSSVFIDNVGQEGGAINCHNQVDLSQDNNNQNVDTKPSQKTKQEIQEPETTRNKVNEREWNTDTEQTARDEKLSRCLITGSKFENNSAVPSAGAVYIRGRRAEIYESNFLFNTGSLGGATRGIQNAEIDIKDSSFWDNTGGIGSNIHIEESTSLNIEGCTFEYNDSAHITGVGIYARNQSSVSISNSSFTNQGTLPVVFEIENATVLTVANTKFVTLQKIGCSALYSINNVKATFTRCSFNRTTGIYASQNTLVTVQESLITDSQHLGQGSTVLIQFGSHIQFINTTIVNNMPPMTQPFLSVSSGALAVITKCVYANNVRQRHVTVQKDSSLIIKDSQLVNNDGTSRSILVGPTSLFEIQDSEVSITGSDFQNNSFHGEMELQASVLFHMVNSEAKFSTSVFTGNAADPFLLAESQSTSPLKYMAIKECVFNNNKGEISIFNIADVFIENSQIQKHSNSINSNVIVLTQPKIVRIGYSSFNSSKKAPLLIKFVQNGWEKKTIALKTLKSTFNDGNHVIQSDSGNFLEEAKEHGFIRIASGTDVNAEETVYASSE